MLKIKIFIAIFIAINFMGGINYSFAGETQSYSNLGYNIDNAVDRSRNHVFIDTIKQIRSFSKGSSTPRGEKAILGNDFYPVEDFGGVLMTGQKPGSIAGVYKGSLTLRNDAPNLKIELVATSGVVQNVVKNGLNVTFEFNISQTADQLMFNIKNTNGGASSIKILRPGYTSDTEIFTSAFLKAISNSKIIRTMDLTATNNSVQEKWENRRSPLDPKQAGDIGVAWEYVIELANKTNKDIWINIPHKADDNYIRSLAKLFKEKLNQNSKIYVEYSNEVWNDMFSQSSYNYSQAEIEQSGGLYNYNYDNINNRRYWGWRRVGLKTKQIGDIFREVFASSDFSKIRPVLGTQLARYEVSKTALKFLQDNYPDVNKYIYGVGYSLYLGFPDTSKTQTISGISTHINGELTKWSQALDDNLATLKIYKLKALAYEGGFESYGINLNKPLAESYLNSSYAQDDLKKLLDTWKSKTNGGEFMYYFGGASNWSAGYNYGPSDNLYNATKSYRQQALDNYFNTPFTPIDDVTWFKKIYMASQPKTPLQINFIFTGSTTSTIKSYQVSNFSYWNGGFPFLDLMKSSTVWTLGRGSDDRANLDLDTNGWVKSMKNIQTGEKIPLVRSILISNPTTYSTGNLIIYYNGEGEFQLFGATYQKTLSTDGRKVFSINPGAGNISLEITDINPDNYLRDIKIVTSSYENLFLSGALFNPTFISSIKSGGYNYIDFKNWTNLNASNTGGINNFNYPTWVKGVPSEVMVALTNQTNTNSIFKLPEATTTTYVNVLMEKVKQYKSDFLNIGVYLGNIRFY